MAAARQAKQTRDHEIIRHWAEERGGHPATVKRTAKGEEAGILRIDFPGYSGERSLKPIDWDEFFEKFDEKKLVFLYQDKTAGGKTSRFFKFVTPESADQKGGRSKSQAGRRATAADLEQERGGRSQSNRAAPRRPAARSSGRQTGGAARKTSGSARKSAGAKTRGASTARRGSAAGRQTRSPGRSGRG